MNESEREKDGVETKKKWGMEFLFGHLKSPEPNLSALVMQYVCLVVFKDACPLKNTGLRLRTPLRIELKQHVTKHLAPIIEKH